MDIPVKVTDPDESTEETPVKVTVTPNQAQENTPGYEAGNTTPGNPVTVPQTGDTEVPPRTKVEVHTPTYQESTTSEKTVKGTVNPKQGEDNKPQEKGRQTRQRCTRTRPQTGDTELPPGTKFEVPTKRVPEGWTVTVDPDNGTVT
ncbi:hypothetical protein DOS80_04015, partial [Staphylococcus felis]